MSLDRSFAAKGRLQDARMDESSLVRIDHILGTEAVAARVVGAEIDRNERKGKQPSDHAPVWADFDI